jgi:Cu(I)/Ag(I) efflux system protein CusF
VRKLIASVLFAVLSAQSALAEDAHHKTGALADGEIRKVDKDAGKLTIKHGTIPSMDMPPMTMVYRVKEPAMLDRVKPGDKVKFTAEKLGGAYTVTTIEKAQ